MAKKRKPQKNTKGRRAAQKKYNAKPEQKRRRAMRNKARRAMMREGRVRKGDGKDVHHIDGNPMNTKRSNFAVQSKSRNRRNNNRKKK